MSDYEDEDLPSISVNAANDSDSFVMPDAHILASQRAEEAAREDEIKRMRSEAATENSQEGAIDLLRRTDSSGSEGEGALAATLNALQVAPAPTVHPSIHPATVLQELVDIMPSPAANLLHEMSMCLLNAEPLQLEIILDDLVNTIEDMTLTTPSNWNENDLNVACGACAAATQGCTDQRARARTRRARRLLQHLLDNVATPYQIDTIAAEWSQLPEQLLVTLAGVMRGASDNGGARVAHSLNSRATRMLLKESKQFMSFYGGLDARSLQTLVKESWRSLSAKDQHRAVPLIGRALRDARLEEFGRWEEVARERLLNALAKPIAGADRTHPDRLKVLVGVSKLQLLFRNKH